MIYCCGVCRNPDKTVFLSPDAKYRDRKLEILECPKCGKLHAVLTQFNVKIQQYEIFKPKRKKVAKFLHDNETELNKWQEVKIKYGTREKAGFIYGINRESKNGTIYQFAADFNGEKRLVKIVQGCLKKNHDTKRA